MITMKIMMKTNNNLKKIEKIKTKNNKIIIIILKKSKKKAY